MREREIPRTRFEKISRESENILLKLIDRACAAKCPDEQPDTWDPAWSLKQSHADVLRLQNLHGQLSGLYFAMRSLYAEQAMLANELTDEARKLRSELGSFQMEHWEKGHKAGQEKSDWPED